MEVALNKIKAKYTIKDKFSGEVVGYAFMLTDGKVSLDQVVLDPWDHHALNPGPGHTLPASTPVSLESDLDISEDSSVNSTADEMLSIPDCNANKDISENDEILKNIDSSAITKEANDDMKTRQVVAFSSIQSVTQTIASQIAAQVVAGESHKSFSRIEPGHDREGGEVFQDQTCSERIAPSTKFAPGHGRYGAFYTDEGVAQPTVKKYKNHKLVRCLLCKEEKILALSNFGGHCQAVHEPPVQCSLCGLEFTSARIRTHKQICRRRLLGKSGESPISRHKKIDKVEKIENKIDECENKVENLENKAVKCDKALDGENVMFTFTSSVKKEASVKVAMKKGMKVKKAMKKFANRFNVTKEMLIFEFCGTKLTGKELVDELDGKEILVHGELKYNSC